MKHSHQVFWQNLKSFEYFKYNSHPCFIKNKKKKDFIKIFNEFSLFAKKNNKNGIKSVKVTHLNEIKYRTKKDW